VLRVFVLGAGILVVIIIFDDGHRDTRQSRSRDLFQMDFVLGTARERYSLSPVPRSTGALRVWIAKTKQQGDEGFRGRNWTEPACRWDLCMVRECVRDKTGGRILWGGSRLVHVSHSAPAVVYWRNFRRF
jgi:hypothetical protein